MRYGLDGRGSITAGGKKLFFPPQPSQTGSGANPAPFTIGTGALFPGVKKLGLEIDHSPPASAKANFNCPTLLHSVVLNKLTTGEI
jgi:hypothetical protein